MNNKATTNNGLAIASVMIATLCMALQDAIVKLASNDLTLWQLFTLRGCISLLVLSVLFLLLRNSSRILPRNFIWSIIRSCLLVFMYIAFYVALFFVDLSVVAGLYYTGPIFIALFSWMLLNEKINILNIASILLGFIGVIVIILPGESEISVTILLPLLSAIFYALAMVTTKGKCQNESLFSLVVSLNLVFIVIGSIVSAVLPSLNLTTSSVSAAPFLLANWAEVNPEEWGILSLLAGINVVIHFLLARAYKVGTPSVVAGFDYSYLIFAVLWGWVLLAEVPEINTTLGIGTIILSGMIPMLYRALSPKRLH